jgi:hypothetical protein
LRLEIKEYLFPTSLKMGIILNRFLPQFVNDKIISHFLPSEY